MKKIYLIILTVLVVSCQSNQKVMVRLTDNGDCIFENDRVAYRIYGAQSDIISPGADIWVKAQGKLILDKWYKLSETDPQYFYRNHTGKKEYPGKDCYNAQSYSLNAGASVPIYQDSLVFPTQNFDKFELIESTKSKVVFSLHYPQWTIGENTVELTREITLAANDNFCTIDDIYDGDFYSMACLVGISTQEVVNKDEGLDYIITWEKASDQSVENEDGMIGLGIVMPENYKMEYNEERHYAVAHFETVRGRKVSYAIGSCWSKGNIPSFDEWKKLVSY